MIAAANNEIILHWFWKKVTAWKLQLILEWDVIVKDLDNQQ